MRRALAPLLAALLVMLSALPVLAAGKPEKTQNELLPPELYAAGIVCDFDLVIEYLIDTGHAITFPVAEDGTQRQNVGGHLVVRVTNSETGASVTYNISGPGKFLFHGEQLTIAGGGPWLLYAFPGDAGGPGMWFTRGRIGIEVDLNTGAWLAVSKPHNTVDVCAVLGGSSAAE